MLSTKFTITTTHADDFDSGQPLGYHVAGCAPSDKSVSVLYRSSINPDTVSISYYNHRTKRCSGSLTTKIKMIQEGVSGMLEAHNNRFVDHCIPSPDGKKALVIQNSCVEIFDEGVIWPKVIDGVASHASWIDDEYFMVRALERVKIHHLLRTCDREFTVDSKADREMQYLLHLDTLITTSIEGVNGLPPDCESHLPEGRHCILPLAPRLGFLAIFTVGEGKATVTLFKAFKAIKFERTWDLGPDNQFSDHLRLHPICTNGFMLFSQTTSPESDEVSAQVWYLRHRPSTVIGPHQLGSAPAGTEFNAIKTTHKTLAVFTNRVPTGTAWQLHTLTKKMR